MANKNMIDAKSYSATYLYSKYPEFEKAIFKFIMNGEEVMKNDESFDDIRYEVKKRQVSSSLVKVLDSPRIKLLINTESLAKPFKVVAAKNPKGNRELIIYVDCTDIITNNNGYACKHIDILISRLVSAMVHMIYYADPDRINISGISSDGATAFSRLFTYVLDYMFKIGTMFGTKDKCVYLATMYYLVNIMGKDIDSNSVSEKAMQQSGLSTREKDIINMYLKPNSFDNIKYFIQTCSEVLNLPKLTIDLFIEKWMYLYGTGTTFAVEVFPAFSTMMTDAYVGAYINNQKTIEKVAGDAMVQFTKSVLTVGERSV